MRDGMRDLAGLGIDEQVVDLAEVLAGAVTYLRADDLVRLDDTFLTPPRRPLRRRRFRRLRR